MDAQERVFLLTDIEGSTAMWDAFPEQMMRALVRHDDLVGTIVVGHRGRLIKSRGEGDSTFSVFEDAADAVAAALETQRGLAAEPWPDGIAIRVRMAIHAGGAIERDDDYFGDAVNRCARLRAAGHGGQILLTEAVASTVNGRLPDAASLQDLGIHRLRDLSRPERVFQLRHPELAADFPAIATLDHRRHNLPSETTSFVGRRNELEALGGILGRERLVTLSGAGGSGKTRLSLRVARSEMKKFPDGVWLVDLASVTRPEIVPAAVAAALGVRDVPGRSLLDAVIEHLRERVALLIFDNCEHLVRVCAEVVSQLLAATEHVHILVTTREVLGVTGEMIFNVPPLPTQVRDGSADPTAGDATRLFVDRFASARGGAPPDASAIGAVAEICRQLDGIPLAIEIAAAKARTIGIPALRDRLHDRFGVLTGGSTVSLPRHKTLRALVDWSFDLLAASERHLLALLAVFVGGWTVEAAEAVCATPELDGPEIVAALTSLTDKSMILAEEIDGAIRYRMLETIREYAQEKLSHWSEAPYVRSLHLQWALALGAAARADYGTTAESERLHTLETEHANLRAALEWANEIGAIEDASRLAIDLGRFWELRGHWSEGVSMFERVLTRADPSALTAEALICLSRLRQDTGDFAGAHDPAQRALAMARDAGDARVEAQALYELGSLALAAGEAGSDDLMQHALRIRREIGDERAIAESLTNLSYQRKGDGDLEGARAVLEEALGLFRSAGNAQGISWVLTSYSDVSGRLGDLDRSERQNQEALALRREIGDDRGVADSLTNLGGLWSERGDLARARDFFQEAFAIYDRLGQPDGIRWSRANLAVQLCELGDFSAARPLLEGMLDVAPADSSEAAVVLGYLGAAAWAEGDVVAAVRLVARARAIGDRFGEAIVESRVWTRLEPRLEAVIAGGRRALDADAFDAACRDGIAWPTRSLLGHPTTS